LAVLGLGDHPGLGDLLDHRLRHEHALADRAGRALDGDRGPRLLLVEALLGLGQPHSSTTGTLTWRSTIGPGTVVTCVSYRPHSRTTSLVVVTGRQTV
jgi:hypothetical protein